jgi:hypothetical protein
MIKRNLHIILACFVGTSVLFLVVDRPINAAQETLDYKAELQQINEEIKKCEDLRDRHLSAAARAQDQGMRWQFMQDQKQEAKRAFEREDANRKEAAALQNQIDLLNKRKAQILKEYP